MLWYSELLLSVVLSVWAYVLDRLRVEAQRCRRFDEPKSRKLCRRSKLRGVGNDALRRFAALG